MLHRRIRLLVAATITYNVIEAIVAITARAVACSTALIGFGPDFVVEVASGRQVADAQPQEQEHLHAQQAAHRQCLPGQDRSSSQCRWVDGTGA